MQKICNINENAKFFSKIDLHDKIKIFLFLTQTSNLIILIITITTKTIFCFIIFLMMTTIFFVSNFLIFEIEIEFATKTTFDLMIRSKRNLIDIDIKLKLIVNFSNLNNLKNCFALIFDLKLTTTLIFCSIVFWMIIVIFFVSIAIYSMIFSSLIIFHNNNISNVLSFLSNSKQNFIDVEFL